jgi:hypothetical protein
MCAGAELVLLTLYYIGNISRKGRYHAVFTHLRCYTAQLSSACALARTPRRTCRPTALLWLRVVGIKLSLFDWVGASVVLLGSLIIVSGWGS